MTTETSFERKSVTGETLRGKTFEPTGRPIATLIHHHGLGEHLERHRNEFLALNAAGVRVVTYDAYGHGLSTGTRAYFSWPQLVTDLVAVIREEAPRSPGGKVFVMGNSLGGLTAVGAALETQPLLRGLLVISPGLDVKLTVTMRAQNLLSPLLNILAPKAKLVPAVRPEDINRNPEKVKEYLEDPLVTSGNVRVRCAVTTLAGMDSTRARWAEISVPLLGVHGTDDRCTDPQATEAFVAAASSADKTWLPIPGGFHEPLNEVDGDAYIAKIVDWVVARARVDATDRPAPAPATTKL